MNETEQNKLYCVTAHLQKITSRNTQFDAVESALDAARSNFTPYIDLISFVVDKRESNNSVVVAYIEAKFYVTATHATEVKAIATNTIKGLSLPNNGHFFILEPSFVRVEAIDEVSDDWLRSVPFSADPDESAMMTCREILTQ